MPETHPPATLPTAPDMLATRIADLTRWTLVAICRCRHHPVALPLAIVAAHHGDQLTLRTVVARLRCETCRRPPSRVDAVLGDPFGTRPWRVKLAP